MLSSTLLLAACSGSAAGPGDDHDPDGDPNTVTLQVTATNVDPGAAHGQVYAWVGDAPIRREQMPEFFGEDLPAIDASGAATRNAFLSVPRGKVVTLIAVELAGPGISSVEDGSVEFSPPPSASEFTGWSGPHTGRLTTTEPGVAVITMDGDASVTADFRGHVAVSIEATGCTDLTYQVNAPPRLGFGPPRLEETIIGRIANRPPATTPERLLLLHGRQGTRFTFSTPRVERRTGSTIAAGFIRWDVRGMPATCGGAQVCSLRAPSHADDRPVMRMQNSWLEDHFTAAGVRCGSCSSSVSGCLSSLRP